MALTTKRTKRIMEKIIKYQIKSIFGVGKFFGPRKTKMMFVKHENYFLSMFVAFRIKRTKRIIEKK